MANIEITSTILGKGSLLKKLAGLSENGKTSKPIFKALLSGGLMIQATAVKSIVSTSPGSTNQVRYEPKRNVRVSPPGKPPNADTGRLAQSVKVGFNEQDNFVTVGTDLAYGGWLEFGTQDMAPRPWLRPAYFSNVKKIMEMINKAIAETLKGAK
jgi:HK97 gp10 family phage protein